MAEKRDENGGRDPVSGRFANGNPGGGRRPMPPEVREMLEAASPNAVRRLVEALDATKPVVVFHGKDEGSTVEHVDDYDMRVKAAEVILNRLYGKPAQAITDADGGPLIDPELVVGVMRKIVGG